MYFNITNFFDIKKYFSIYFHEYINKVVRLCGKSTRELNWVSHFLYLSKTKELTMKEFKKNEQELFVCEECGKLFKNKYTLGSHIISSHYSRQQYFDKWLKDDENLCKICGKETVFRSINEGYRTCCSVEHLNKWRCTQIQKVVKQKYGVNSAAQAKEIKEKTMQTCLSKYGVKNAFQCEKSKITCLKNHGVEYSLKSKKVREKGKLTSLKKLRHNASYEI
jgi:hypothetical protein